jgi:Brp/Blh family beta-carotene 15,15'-monooxygenase
MPLWGLLAFLSISVAHFGEGEATTSSWVGRYHGWLFGIGAILLPIGFHIDQAGDYLAYFVSSAVFSGVSVYIRYSALVIGSLIAAQLARAIVAQRSWNRSDTLQRGVCLACWLMLPPLAGFAVWFVGRHSRLHLETCAARLSDSSRGLPLDFIAISVLAILGLAPFSLMFDFSDIGQLFAAALCLIAGLTLPHMIVTYGMREDVARRSGGPERLRE